MVRCGCLKAIAWCFGTTVEFLSNVTGRLLVRLSQISVCLLLMKNAFPASAGKEGLNFIQLMKMLTRICSKKELNNPKSKVR